MTALERMALRLGAALVLLIAAGDAAGHIVTATLSGADAAASLDIAGGRTQLGSTSPPGCPASAIPRPS